MDIQVSMQELQREFIELAIKQDSQQETILKANCVVAPAMPWEKNPNQIDQFNKMYLSRLNKLSNRINAPKLRKIQQLDDKLRQTVSIAGIFKRIQFERKRAFEHDYNQHYQNATRIYDERDSQEIEDSSGRVKFVLDENATLNGRPVKKTDLPYGIIIGLTGYYHQKNHHFVAQSITLPSLAPQKNIPFIQKASPRKLLIMSEPHPESVIRVLKEIVDYGFEKIKRQITTIIIMGFGEGANAENIKKMDKAFSTYSQYIDIFVMPGANAKQSYPQKPLHPIMFKNSYKNVGFVSNPQYFQVNPSENVPEIDENKMQAKMLLFSGQNLKDLIKNCSFGQSSLDTLQSIFQYSHMSPTTPFSLKSWMTPQDYLVIQQLPHLAVAGNCQSFATRDFESEGKRVRLVTMKTGDMSLVDIDDLRVDKFILTGPQIDSCM